MPVTVRGSFRRSVHLSRDVYGDGAHEGYVVTAKAREVLGRVAEALAAPVAQRAWSVTGPYGGGKSAFALFLSGLLRGDAAAWARLRETVPDLAAQLEAVRGGAFCPVLVVGSREPLVPALLRGLADGIEAFLAHHRPLEGGPAEPSLSALAALAAEARAAEPDEDAVLRLVARAARTIRRSTGGGVLLVVDELGKMLEHAALHPEAADLFVLQRLAEQASRAPEGGEEAPVLLVTILHQAFDRYAGRLGSEQRDEWRKVQGRFEDVAFISAAGETAQLLAEAIGVDPPTRLPETAGAEVDALLACARRPPGTDAGVLRQRLGEALPLHPAVALLVGPLFRRLAQNERSLFAFLASGEPHGFLDVSGGETVEAPLYRLDHLYDYLVAHLGATLFSERMERLWAETEAALSALDGAMPLDARLVKHAALLGFAGALAGLEPTAATLAATTGAPEAEVQAALNGLRQRRALAFRPFGETYHVWQGSTFDLAAALREARLALPPRTPLADLLRRALPPRPVLARRHAYRTGTPRVFDAVYTSEADALRAATARRRTDGRLVYVLPEDGDPEAVAARLAAEPADPLAVFAVPDEAAALRDGVRDLACLDWVAEHAEALRGDPAARRELAEQRDALAAHVERRLSRLFAPGADGRVPCTWVRAGRAFRISDPRGLQPTLSTACDEVFAHAPEVWNELLNRRKPSASAVRGLKLLLEAMLERGGEPRLGIEGTPAEYGMYASVLQATGLHREIDGRWQFARPDPEARPGCAAVWDALAETLRQPDAVPLGTVYERLAAPPYGVRAGLIPVFLFAFLAHARDEIAVFEAGTLVRELSFETVERLLKSQEKGRDTFRLQWVAVAGARAAALRALAPLLGLSETVERPLPVALRLLRQVHELPPYVRTTGTLAETTAAVREALHRATDPSALLFEALPQACGLAPFTAGGADDAAALEAFAERVGGALRELGSAYGRLLAEIDARLGAAFGLRGSTADARRHALADRARALLPAATDLGLRAFLVRATDEILDTTAWTESLAALLARRPPAQWADADLGTFEAGLRETADAFFKLEPLAFALTDGGGAEGDPPEGAVRQVRLFVKTLREAEADGVIHVHPEDDALVDRLHARLDETLGEAGAALDVELAALSRLVAERLRQRQATGESRAAE